MIFVSGFIYSDTRGHTRGKLMKEDIKRRHIQTAYTSYNEPELYRFEKYITVFGAAAIMQQKSTIMMDRSVAMIMA